MFGVNYFCRSCCLSQKRYSAIIVAILLGVEREEGLPLLALPREKPPMLSGHDTFDCARTVSPSAAIRWPALLDLIYLASMIRDRLVHGIALGPTVSSTGRAYGEHEPSRPLRTPGLHASLQAPELYAGGIEIGKLDG